MNQTKEMLFIFKSDKSSGFSSLSSTKDQGRRFNLINMAYRRGAVHKGLSKAVPEEGMVLYTALPQVFAGLSGGGLEPVRTLLVLKRM